MGVRSVEGIINNFTVHFKSCKGTAFFVPSCNNCYREARSIVAHVIHKTLKQSGFLDHYTFKDFSTK